MAGAWASRLAGALLAVGLMMVPAWAQKPGGTLTVGLETDIPGFDPLKVGVFDTGAVLRRRSSSIR